MGAIARFYKGRPVTVSQPFAVSLDLTQCFWPY